MPNQTYSTSHSICELVVLKLTRRDKGSTDGVCHVIENSTLSSLIQRSESLSTQNIEIKGQQGHVSSC